MGHVVALLQRQMTDIVNPLTEASQAEQNQAEEDWDKQIAEDAVVGRLDQLIARAEADIATGRIKELDEVLYDI